MCMITPKLTTHKSKIVYKIVDKALSGSWHSVMGWSKPYDINMIGKRKSAESISKGLWISSKYEESVHGYAKLTTAIDAQFGWGCRNPVIIKVKLSGKIYTDIYDSEQVYSGTYFTLIGEVQS